jgi:hypothetical protein
MSIFDVSETDFDALIESLIKSETIKEVDCAEVE